MENIVIHCQPSLLDTIERLNLNWDYSPRFNDSEIDVIIPYDNSVAKLNHAADNDEEFVNHFGLDYDQVNCIELI